MSDAPAHHLFVLVPPLEENSTHLPEPLCVLQVALEGQISRKSVLNSLGRGQRVDGDLIPWVGFTPNAPRAELIVVGDFVLLC